MKIENVTYYICEKCDQKYLKEKDAIDCESRAFSPQLDRVPLLFRSDQFIDDTSRATFCAIKMEKCSLKHYMRCRVKECKSDCVRTVRNQRYDKYTSYGEYIEGKRWTSEYISEDEFYMIDFLLGKDLEPDINLPSFKFMLKYILREGYKYENIYIWNGEKEEILKDYFIRKGVDF